MEDLLEFSKHLYFINIDILYLELRSTVESHFTAMKNNS